MDPTDDRHAIRPLRGVRVLDFSQALAGPYATLVLADLGADVIKVEVPGRGDDTRHWGPPFVGDQSAYFMTVNRNKRSVALDLKTEGGLRAARHLATYCDVVIENFRPGTAQRLGIGPDDVRREVPAVIYCSVSGFGQDGSGKPGYDQIVQGMAGLMSVTGMPDGPPMRVGVPIADIVAGMFAAHAVLAALYDRERTGEGRYIDVAMQDAVIALLTFQAGRYFATGTAPGREGNHHPTIAPYGAFETSDGYVNIGVGNDNQWQRFCTAIAASDLAEDRRFATNGSRVAARLELHAAIEPVLRSRSTAYWLERLEEAGVPAGPIRDLHEVFSDNEVLRRAMKVELGHPTLGSVSVTGAPWKLDTASIVIERSPPLLGQHTREVLGEIAGYDDAQVDALASAGAVAVNDIESYVG